MGETERLGVGGWRKGLSGGGLHNALPPGMNERILTAATSPAGSKASPCQVLSQSRSWGTVG